MKWPSRKGQLIFGLALQFSGNVPIGWTESSDKRKNLSMVMILENAVLIGDELALCFSDGLEAYLALPLLRRACPCAACQGEPDAMGRVVRPKVEFGFGAFELLKFETVGGYAIQLFWSDGHSTGIYSYAYLQKLAGLPTL
jgi:DUF971 family protein